MEHNIYLDFNDKSIFKKEKLEIRCNLLPNVYTKSWTEACSLINIREFDVNTVLPGKENKLKQPGVQIFNYPARLSNKDSNGVSYDWNNWPFWKYWNGLVFIDVDSKKYNGSKVNSLKWDRIEMALYDYMVTNFVDNFYFQQVSNSGKSFHFVFYVECLRTYENFLKSCKYFNTLVVEAFSSLGLKDVIEWNEVMDEHNDNPVQPLFFSRNPIRFCLPECEQRRNFGDSYFLADINLLHNQKQDIDFKNTDVSFDINEISDEIKNSSDITSITWSHDYRLRLAIALYHVFSGDYDKAWSIYRQVIPFMLKTISNHNEKELVSLFRCQFDKLGSYTISRNMLKILKRCFNIKYRIKKHFEPLKFADAQYDKVYNLNSDEYLSEVIFDIFNLPSNIVHIEAGCGVGKTYSANTLFDKVNEPDNLSTDINDIFNLESISKVKRICFITPMTSINRDNFKEEDPKYANWKIVDGNHYKNKDYLKSEYNICTTWDSFIKNEMYKDNSFECFMFDEIHSLYMYDYRTDIISKIKNAINELSGLNKKVLLLTGTPSLETKEFDCFKVKVNKELIPINANIIFYNEQYLGYLTQDIKKWMSSCSSNRFAVFTDGANFDLQEKFKQRGLDVDFLYNKQIHEDVDFANSKHDMKSQGGMFSVYGQAGINLYSKTPIRLYILNNSAMSIIQYANRFRNRENVESINVFYPIEELSSNIKSKEQRTFAEQKLVVDKLNSIFYSSVAGNPSFVLNIKFGVNMEYMNHVEDLSGRKMLQINEEKYDTFVKIDSVKFLEKQMQFIYNRLVSNYFIPNFIYLDEDVTDQWRTKYRGHFSGGLIEATNNFKKFVKMNTKTFKLYVSIQDESCKTLAKTCPESTKKKLEYIFNSLNEMEDPNIQHEERMQRVENIWKCFINGCLNRKCESVRRTDINNFADVIHIKKHLHELKDGFIVDQILKKRDEKGNMATTDICILASAYTTIFRNCQLTLKDCFMFAEEVYQEINRLAKYIDEYEWFINWDDVINNYEDARNSLTDDKMKENQLFLDYLYNKHQRGKTGGKTTGKVKANNCKTIEINGKVYSSKTEAMKKLKIGRKKLEKLINL